MHAVAPVRGGRDAALAPWLHPRASARIRVVAIGFGPLSGAPAGAAVFTDGIADWLRTH